MKNIHYPVRGRKLDEVINQHTFELLMAELENWQQGPGVFGHLNIHACWGTASVLDKRYQGETVSHFVHFMRTLRTIYDRTKNPKWRVLVNSMAAHLLYLQDKSGGFIHATAEFEPTFDTRGCPIHYFNPIIALCEYYAWDAADETIQCLIPAAIERHWDWAIKHTWMRGNGRFHPLTFPGWCGVTNQDLTVVAATTYMGKLFGNWAPYETYGKPSLDYYLSPAYYYKDVGLFERGDGVNYPERTPYYNVILDCFRMIYANTGDERVMEAYDNVCDHLFDTVFVGPDGMTHLARGAILDPDDRSTVKAWEYAPISFSALPAQIRYLREYLTRHPSAERDAIVDRLSETLAAYVFVDGNIPLALFGKNPLFAIVSQPECEGILAFVVEYLGDRLQDPQPVDLPTIHRSSENYTWKQKERLWALEADGVRKYGGFTRYVGGLTLGPDEKPVLGDYASLEACDVYEIID